MADLVQLGIQQEAVDNDQKLWAALMYPFPLMSLLVLFAMEDKKAVPYLRFHAIQSLALGLVVAAAAIVTCGTIGTLLWFVTLLFGYKAFQGEVFEIPVVTNFLEGKGYFEPVKQLTNGDM